MLLQLTALALSLSLGGGSGAFGAPEMRPQAVDTVAIDHINLAPGAGDFRDAGAESTLAVDPAHPRLGGNLSLLRKLGGLPAGDLEAFVKDHPDAISALLGARIPPQTISTWWTTMGSGAKQQLIDSAPQLIGNLNGVPFDARGLANNVYLNATIAKLEKKLSSGVGRGMNVEVTNHLTMLTHIRDALTAKQGDPQRTLVGLDTVSPGRAAIVIGDVATADFVSYLIPGMFFTINGQVGYWADTATTLYHDQTRWLERLGESTKTVATVAWIGYQTPHLLNVGSLTLAQEGAQYLTGAINGLRSLRGSSQPYVSIMAHSYGSTAALMALQSGDIEVDALAIVGSPGSSAQNASDLAVRNGNVYVGEAGWDPVVNSAFYGSDPGAVSYGAHRMSVAGGTDAITSVRLGASYGHNEYFQPGSESMRNFALIGIGEGGLVMDNTGRIIASEQR